MMSTYLGYDRVGIVRTRRLHSLARELQATEDEARETLLRRKVDKRVYSLLISVY